jgi:hypothetical protein
MKTIIEKLIPSTEFKLSLQSFIIGLFVGSMVVGYSVYYHLEKNYVRLQKTNIGYVIIKNEHIYSLYELEK